MTALQSHWCEQCSLQMSMQHANTDGGLRPRHIILLLQPMGALEVSITNVIFAKVACSSKRTDDCYRNCLYKPAIIRVGFLVLAHNRSIFSCTRCKGDERNIFQAMRQFGC